MNSLSDSWNVNQNGREDGWEERGGKKNGETTNSRTEIRTLRRAAKEIPCWGKIMRPAFWSCSIGQRPVYPEQLTLPHCGSRRTHYLVIVTSSDFPTHIHQIPLSLKEIWESLSLATESAHLASFLATCGQSHKGQVPYSFSKHFSTSQKTLS